MAALRRIGLLVAVLAVWTSGARADGVYFPQEAYKKLPAIPRQRALIAYRNGTERLVIESALDAEGQSFGWVIPLPAAPETFEKASPGFLRTLSLVVKPRITNRLARQRHRWRVVAVLAGVWAAIVSLVKRRRRWFAALSLPVFIVAGLFLGQTRHWKHGRPMAATDMGRVPGVTVEQTAVVGSYELSVLRARSADSLDEWLGTNGFARLPETGRGIVGDYVRDNWRFVTAKLRREGAGLSVPHPLAMTFAAEKPVYPMKLTALAGTSVYLELFVLADRRATCDDLTLEYSDTYRRRETDTWTGMNGVTFDVNIAHPVALKEMWDGCVVTKLTGEPAPTDMTDDLMIGFRSPAPYRQHLYSERAARDMGEIGASIACIVALALGILVPYGVTIVRRPRGFAIPAGVLLAALVYTWVPRIVYGFLPRTEVEMRTRGFGGRPGGVVPARMLAEAYAGFPGKTPADVEGIYANYLHCFGMYHGNPFTGRPVGNSDAPGDYVIIEDDRGIVLRTFGRNGHPSDVIVSADGIVKAYTRDLKREKRPYNELRELELVRDPRIVEPLLDLMKYWHEKDYCIDTGALTKTTGFDFYCNRWEDWSKWWAENKDKSRVEWLRAAIGQKKRRADGGGPSYAAVTAAIELALLGDDAGVPLLLSRIEARDRSHECAIALVWLGRDEGLQYLGRELRAGWWPHPTDRVGLMFLRMLEKQPGKGIPILLDHLRELKPKLVMRRGGHYFVDREVAALAYVTGLALPLVRNEHELDEFISDVEERAR